MKVNLEENVFGSPGTRRLRAEYLDNIKEWTRRGRMGTYTATNIYANELESERVSI